MSTRKIIAIVLLIIGAGLLFFGLQATGSLTEEVHETLTGRFTDTTTWYLLGGGAAVIVGIVMLARGGR